MSFSTKSDLHDQEPGPHVHLRGVGALPERTGALSDLVLELHAEALEELESVVRAVGQDLDEFGVRHHVTVDPSWSAYHSLECYAAPPEEWIRFSTQESSSCREWTPTLRYVFTMWLWTVERETESVSAM